ncbi:MAG: hypothetical protein E7446_01570 [Ruminococcaceae bacterium]|nr:hypothetical protein [Oscillospiraceae bacterium]
MSIQILQERVRRCKTPVILGIGAEKERLPQALLRQFTEMYGEGTVAVAEALRYHGTRALAAVEQLPAVYLRADRYLPYGAVGMDVLANLVSAAKSRGAYVIVDCRTGEPNVWLQALPGADAVTVTPYVGGECCAVTEDKAVFALVRTAGTLSGEIQNLMSGDRKLYQAAAGQMARHGAGLVVETGYSLDIRELRRRCDKAMLLLTNCTGEDASYAFDDYGHGAVVVDDTIQYAADVQDAAVQAVKEMKRWTTVL